MGISDEEQLAIHDTDRAVHARMTHLEACAAAFTRSVKLNPKHPSAWTQGLGELAPRIILPQPVEAGIAAASDAVVSDFTTMVRSSMDELKKAVLDPAITTSDLTTKPLSVKQVETFIFSHRGWAEIAEHAASPFLAFFGKIMEDACPILPADFVERNQLYPAALFPSGVTKQQAAYHFVRKGSFFACCAGAGLDSVYKGAVEKYNAAVIREILAPSQLAVKKEGANHSVVVPALVDGVYARAQVLLVAVERGWAPAEVVCPVASALLPSLAEMHHENATEEPAKVKRADLEELAKKFSAVELKDPLKPRPRLIPVVTGEEPHGEDEGSNNNKRSSSSNNNNDNNCSSSSSVFRNLESWIHLLVSSHFHCRSIDASVYPRSLGTLIADVLPFIRRIVWSARKSVVARVCVEWSNYGVKTVDQLIGEASTAVTLTVTDASPGSKLQIQVHEPEKPFRPSSGPELEAFLNSCLDGFIERYRELLGAAVRFSRGACATSSSGGSGTGGGGGGGGGGDSSATVAAAFPSTPHTSASCCGHCTKGLATALRRVVPENSDVMLVRTLQNRLRQKLVVKYTMDDSDRAVVMKLLSEVAAQVWHVAVGGDLAKDIGEVSPGRKLDDGDDDGGADAGRFSPVGDNDDDGEHSLSSGAAVEDDAPYSTSSPDEILLADERALDAIGVTIDRARGRVVWHASAEMTRLTDAISELVVQRRCPAALKNFVSSVVPRCASVAQGYLLMQAQALLTAKELARTAEKICDLGFSIGGATATALSRREASVIELGKAAEQAQHLLAKFPRALMDKHLPASPGGSDFAAWDSDEDDAGSNTAAINANVGDGSGEDGFSSSRDNDVQDDAQNAFAQFGKVLPLCKVKTSADIYAQLVRGAE